MGGDVKHRSGLSRWLGIVAASSVCLALAACQQGIETAGKVDAPGVPVAFDTIEGAPDAVLSKVSAEVSSQATARRIELVSGESQPRYRLKGYLTAYSTEDGETALAFVWDVFEFVEEAGATRQHHHARQGPVHRPLGRRSVRSRSRPPRRRA